MKERMIRKVMEESVVTVACFEMETLESVTLDFVTKPDKNTARLLKTLKNTKQRIYSL